MLQGAPERVLRRCTMAVERHGNVTELGDMFTAAFDIAYKAIAGKGQRVLAFAFVELAGEYADPSYSFTIEPANYPEVCEIEQHQAVDRAHCGLLLLLLHRTGTRSSA